MTEAHLIGARLMERQRALEREAEEKAQEDEFLNEAEAPAEQEVTPVPVEELVEGGVLPDPAALAALDKLLADGWFAGRLDMFVDGYYGNAQQILTQIRAEVAELRS